MEYCNKLGQGTDYRNTPFLLKISIAAIAFPKSVRP